MDQLFGLYFLYVIEFMKRNNSNFNYSKRRFNFFIIMNLFFISIFGSSKVKIKKNEIKYKNYIWFLNENDK